MKILVFGDTHIPKRYEKVPQKIFDNAEECDLVVFTGDCSDIETYDEIEKKIGKDKLKAVHGNMDSLELQSLLPETLLLEVKGKRIGVFHGDGSPEEVIGIVKNKLTQKYDELDLIIFGHSHHAFNEEKDGILFFNPGSPTDTMFAKFKSYGILEINKEIKGKIIKI